MIETIAEDVRQEFNAAALDENGRPTEVAPIVPETADEKRRYNRAAKRRANRVMERRYDQGRGE